MGKLLHILKVPRGRDHAHTYIYIYVYMILKVYVSLYRIPFKSSYSASNGLHAAA